MQYDKVITPKSVYQAPVAELVDLPRSLALLATLSIAIDDLPLDDFEDEGEL